MLEWDILNYLKKWRTNLRATVKEGGRVFPQVKLEKLKPLPIVIPTKEERKKVEDIVSQIIDLRSKSQDTEDLEVYLNQVVNKLYMK